VYRFDEAVSAEGYVRFCTAGDADAARRDLNLKRMCGGKEPELMGEHVFENELKFKRGLSVMGSLYASATGTCVLQLTDPPGKLGHDGAPSELVSESTGTVFVVELQKLLKELGDKSLDELQKVLQEELQMEIGDELLEEPGDGVLLPTPTYAALYNDFSVLSQAQVLDVPTSAADGFAVTDAEGVALMRALRGRVPGHAIPAFVRESPNGGGKKPVVG
jgi:hypothetical protein